MLFQNIIKCTIIKQVTSFKIKMQNQFNNQMSLYIPHVFSNFTAEYISNVFNYSNIGMVDHVDLVAKIDKQDKPYNAVYVHFAYWFDNPFAKNFQAKVLDPKNEARIIHDDPWFWIVLENTAKKHVPGARKECLDLSESLPAEYDKYIEEYEENSYLEEELIKVKKSLTISDEQLCQAQEHNCKLEAELDDMQEVLIDQELELQAEMTKLNNIIQKILHAQTLEEAKNSLLAELN